MSVLGSSRAGTVAEIRQAFWGIAGVRRSPVGRQKMGGAEHLLPMTHISIKGGERPIYSPAMENYGRNISSSLIPIDE